MSELELRFRDEGGKDQLPVVFLHAFPYHGAMWDGQRRALAGQARCITLDARGVGPGAAPSCPYMLEHLVANLVAIATRTDVRAALPAFRVPTRVIVGADDAITPLAAARAMAEAIAGADLHILEHAGHLSNVEAEPAFNQLLLEHLAKLR